MELFLSRERFASAGFTDVLDTRQLAELFWLAKGAKFSAGSAIIEGGAPADGKILVLVSGQFTVDGYGETISPENQGAGILLGEVAILNPQGKRTATVTAVTDCEALEWVYPALPQHIKAALQPLFERVAFERIANYFPKGR